MTDRPYWCEICARKKECYGITLKPKCFVPTADRKTEPTISKMEQVDEPQSLEQFRVGLEYHTDTTHFGKVKGESVTTNEVKDEPQTERYCTNCKHNGVIEDYECRECCGMDKHEFIEPQTGRSE